MHILKLAESFLIREKTAHKRVCYNSPHIKKNKLAGVVKVSGVSFNSDQLLCLSRYWGLFYSIFTIIYVTLTDVISLKKKSVILSFTNVPENTKKYLTLRFKCFKTKGSPCAKS